MPNTLNNTKGELRDPWLNGVYQQLIVLQELDYQAIVEHRPQAVSQMQQAAELLADYSIEEDDQRIRKLLNNLDTEGAEAATSPVMKVLEGRLAHVCSSGDPRLVPWSEVNNRVGLSDVRQVIALDQVQEPGLAAIFVSAKTVFVAQLRSGSDEQWQVVQSFPYQNKQQVLQYVLRLLADPWQIDTEYDR